MVHPNSAFERQLEIFERWVLGVTIPRAHHFDGKLSITTSGNNNSNNANNANSNNNNNIVNNNIVNNNTATTTNNTDGKPEANEVDVGEDWETPVCELLFGLEFSVKIDRGKSMISLAVCN
jgi:hypothetical protein